MVNQFQNIKKLLLWINNLIYVDRTKKLVENLLISTGIKNNITFKKKFLSAYLKHLGFYKLQT